MWSAASCLFQEMTPPRSPEQVGFVAVCVQSRLGTRGSVRCCKRRREGPVSFAVSAVTVLL